MPKPKPKPIGNPDLWESKAEFIRWHADLPASEISVRGAVFGFDLKPDTIYKTKLRLKGKLEKRNDGGLPAPNWYWERELWRAYIRACIAAGSLLAFDGVDFANLSVERIQREMRKLLKTKAKPKVG